MQLLSYSSLLFTTLSSLLVLSANGQGTGSFISPGPQLIQGDYATGLNFQYGQSQTFTWTVDLPAVRLALWQQGNAVNINGAGTEDILDYNNTQQSFIWDGIPVQSLANGHTFFLQMYDAAVAVGSASVIATSEYFNISDPTSSASSSSSSSSASSVSSQLAAATVSSSSSTRTGSLTTTTTTDATSKPTSNPTSKSSSAAGSATANATAAAKSGGGSSTNSLAIGLGVGLGCALLLILLGLAFLFRRHRKKTKAIGRTHDLHASRDPYSSSEHKPYYSPHNSSMMQAPYNNMTTQTNTGLVIPRQEMWSDNTVVAPSLQRQELQ